MFRSLNEAFTSTTSNYVSRLCASALAMVWCFAPAYAQNNFNSGSTGADGVFAPTTSQTVQLPESGVFNFTTVNIPTGVTIKFGSNSKNTSVTILASGDITIAGIINVNGQPGIANGIGGQGGQGGFKGGTGGYRVEPYTGTAGDGRGGGSPGGSDGITNMGGGGGGGYGYIGTNGDNNGNPNARVGQGGPRYGTFTLLPLVGGSGGGGGGAYRDLDIGGAGGGGGGAILIASTGTITFSGSIQARGGDGVTVRTGGGGGGGSGGGVRLIANTVSGTGSFDVRGGTRGSITNLGSPGGNGAGGYIRVEAFNSTNFNPNTNTGIMAMAMPNPVTAPNNPQLRIASIAGVAPPNSPLGALNGVPDVLLPSVQANPVDVLIEASGITLGTVIQVTIITPTGTRTVFQSTPLAGTVDASSGTASVSLPSGMSVINVTATMNMATASAKPMFIDGERVNRIELAAAFGSASKATYITSSGKRRTFE